MITKNKEMRKRKRKGRVKEYEDEKRSMRRKRNGEQKESE